MDQAAALLEHLRVALPEPGLQYAEPPAPISGGYDTKIFGFRLSGAPAPFASPLILRVLGTQYPAARALSERATQNAVAGLGYPAPRVLLASADPAILGGAFLVMERLYGRPLLEARRIGIASVLAEMQLRLHALDAEVLLRALDREGPPISRETATFDGHLARLERRIAHGGLHGLEPAMRWLLEHRPLDGPERVICHGDLHPQNILMADGRVTGVLDWPNVVVADREFDVAATCAIRFVPAAVMGVPRALRALVTIAAHVLAARHVSAYRRGHALDPARLAYHEALACMRGFLRTAEARAAGGPLNPLDASVFGDRLGARFARITGVVPILPAGPQETTTARIGPLTGS
jgi:aminoglycoside phosphotransferase (APT) family kinase protein